MVGFPRGAEIMVIVLLFTTVDSQKSQLYHVPSSLYEFHDGSNGNICEAVTSSYDDGQFSSGLCGGRFLYPKVETFLLDEGICLSNRSQDVLANPSYQVTEETKDFTHCSLPCRVSSFRFDNTTSCVLTQYPSDSLIRGKQVAYGVLNCTGGETKTEMFCLLVVISAKTNSSKKECLNRMIPYSLVVKPSISSTTQPSLTSSKLTPVKPSKRVKTRKGNIIDLMKKNPIIFSAILAGVFVVLVIIVVVIVCLCRSKMKRKTRNSNFERGHSSSLASAGARNGSLESVVYHEPDMSHSAPFRNNSEADGKVSYDYAYAHCVRGNFGCRRDRGYVNVGNARRSDCVRGCSSQDEIDDSDGCINCRLSPADDEKGERPQFSSRGPNRDLKTRPLYYVKVL